MPDRPRGEGQARRHNFREAMHYSKAEGGGAVCLLCPRGCSIGPGGTGACLARRNIDGALYSLNYGKISSINLDPIEKKPLRRFYPGAMILSAGSFGCNFTCPFCQNHSISRSVPQTRAMPPQELVRLALASRVDGNVGIAYTYNEPIIWYEHVLETAGRAYAEGLKNVLVTNGYIEPEPLRELLPFVAAMNVDLKGDRTFYSGVCGGVDQGAVMRTIQAAHAAGCHVEVTHLLVTGHNDSPAAVDSIARQIASVSRDIPLHLSRFFPRYHMQDAPPTGAAFMRDAVAIAKSSLEYVYPGNI
ncbi:MAG: AmmeMemoRadiSam system radical SAM enzyme [Oscillospiraceae bacterium]|nr:AmmeMemoRadiSam system radical SAM enzyme [Oscillospiraceae bacterium]